MVLILDICLAMTNALSKWLMKFSLMLVAPTVRLLVTTVALVGDTAMTLTVVWSQLIVGLRFSPWQTTVLGPVTTRVTATRPLGISLRISCTPLRTLTAVFSLRYAHMYSTAIYRFLNRNLKTGPLHKKLLRRNIVWWSRTGDNDPECDMSSDAGP